MRLRSVELISIQLASATKVVDRLEFRAKSIEAKPFRLPGHFLNRTGIVLTKQTLIGQIQNQWLVVSREQLLRMIGIVRVDR